MTATWLVAGLFAALAIWLAWQIGADLRADLGSDVRADDWLREGGAR